MSSQYRRDRNRHQGFTMWQPWLSVPAVKLVAVCDLYLIPLDMLQEVYGNLTTTKATANCPREVWGTVIFVRSGD
jgi:hypothetical protein